jgi:antitoxin HigA-1
MAEYYTKRPLNRPPIHPGEILREDILPALRLSVSEAARRLGISRQQLHRVLACTHPITTEMALRIGSSPVMVPDFGCACSKSMIFGMPNKR